MLEAGLGFFTVYWVTKTLQAYMLMTTVGDLIKRFYSFFQHSCLPILNAFFISLMKSTIQISFHCQCYVRIILKNKSKWKTISNLAA